jgi:ABC-type lipoprotein release transport system permease subunit
MPLARRRNDVFLFMIFSLGLNLLVSLSPSWKFATFDFFARRSSSSASLLPAVA